MSVKFSKYVSPGMFTVDTVYLLEPEPSVHGRVPPCEVHLNAESLIADLVRRLELRNFPMPIQIKASGLCVIFTFAVKDRDDGTPLKLITECDLREIVAFRDPVTCFLRAVRLALLQGIAHELDECLRFDGKQVRDPHQETDR